MEIRELYALPALKAELQHEIRRIEELNQQAESIVPTLTDMPRSNNVTSKVEIYAIRIHDAEVRVENIHHRIVTIESYIESVNDDMIRAIMKLKFIDGYTYAMIARTIGGRNTKDGIKKMLHRYIQRSQHEEL